VVILSSTKFGVEISSLKSSKMVVSLKSAEVVELVESVVSDENVSVTSGLCVVVVADGTAAALGRT